MHRNLLGRIAVTAAAALLALAALAPLGASAGPASGSGAAASASPSPSPSASTRPAGCPTWSLDMSLATIIATGAAKLAACATADDWTTVYFDAYFPAQRCVGCGGVSPTSIDPAWLSGGAVAFDATTGTIMSAPGQTTRGMRVTTGQPPYAPSDAEYAAWWAVNSYDLRLPTGVGTCLTNDTSSKYCSLSHYADVRMSIQAHLRDDASATCKGAGTDGSRMPAASVVAYCAQQLVVDSFTVLTTSICPAAPYTAEDLSHYTTERLMACLGSAKITVTGYAMAPGMGGRGSAWSGTPGWLVDDFGPGFFLYGWSSVYAPMFEVRVPPALGTCANYDVAGCPFRPFVGRWVKVVGHFEDARSATCKATWSPESGTPPAWFTPAFVRQTCRERFVLLSKPVLAAAPR